MGKDFLCNRLTNMILITEYDRWRGYTRGLTPCAMRAVPACAAMFATVDYARMYFKELNLPVSTTPLSREVTASLMET
jgi:hypothetical protein